MNGYIVEDFKDANEWAKKIQSTRQKERRLRLKEIRQLRTFYKEKYSWESQCQELVATMSNMVYGMIKFVFCLFVRQERYMQHRTNQIVQSDSFILLLFVTQGSNNSD